MGKNPLAANRFGCHQVALLPLHIPQIPFSIIGISVRNLGSARIDSGVGSCSKVTRNMFASIEELSEKLELAKYCPFCRKHTAHKEGKV